MPYLDLAIFPLVAILTMSRTAFSWALRHGRDPMPPDVVMRIEKRSSQIILLRSLLLAAVVSGLTLYQRLGMPRIGLHLHDWERNSLTGLVAGLLALCLQYLVVRILAFPRKRDNIPPLPPSTLQFVLLNVPNVFGEELWVAFCLVGLKDTGHGSALSIMLTAAVFGMMHLHYRLGGALAKSLYGVASASLFLWRGSLLSPYLFHYISNIGTFYWNRRIGTP
jgi:hypothetical protein